MPRKGHIMARTTVKDLEERVNSIDLTLGQLTQMMTQVVEATMAKQAKASKPAKQDKPWVAECPEYATAAQRIEYDKLVAKAKEQREAIMAATGSKAVTAFIPVSKTQDRMPHSIKWNVTY